jgi:magnesium-transporting ATPase (P-type)
LERGLDTSFTRGLTILSDADVKARQELYGANEFPAPEPKTWFGMFLESFEDTTVIVLCVASLVSLAVGLWEDYTKNTSKGWIEGTAILFAVVLVAVVTASNNYNKENQFRKLNDRKDDVEVVVVRNGEVKRISCKALVVGDVCKMEAGDKVPADALLISGSDVSTNESALTGEPEDVQKTTTAVKVSAGGDPFLISGSTLSTGTCSALIIATGANSRWGKSKSKLERDAPATPLQEKLETLANQIGYFGMAMAACTFAAMVYMWWAYPLSREEGQSFTDVVLEAFIMAVTIVVVAVPEGLPLAVTLSLAYSTQKMMDDNNLIRVLEACETMGNATNICSDKTGTLTQNRMTVVECWVAGSRYSELPSASQLPRELVAVLSEGLAVNSTADLLVVDGQTNVKGSKTEGALLMMLQSMLGVDYARKRVESFVPARGDRLFTFSSSRKRMSVLLLNGASGLTSANAEEARPKRASLRGAASALLGDPDKPGNTGSAATLHVKGASEAILDRCSTFLSSSGATVALDAATRKLLSAQISGMAQASLRTIGVAFKILPSIPSTSTSSSSEALADSLERELTFVGLFGIKDPLRPDVPAAVQRCQAAGIFVRMVTGDNLETAQAIARECGILTDGGLAMEGPAFRRLSPAKLDAILPTLQVLARSSPDDKHLLVTRLNGNKEHMPQNQEQWEARHPGRSWSKERDLLLPGYAEEWAASRAGHGCVGEVVGVTGDGTNDGPALKAADVGLSMGLGGTDGAFLPPSPSLSLPLPPPPPFLLSLSSPSSSFSLRQRSQIPRHPASASWAAGVESLGKSGASRPSSRLSGAAAVVSVVG